MHKTTMNWWQEEVGYQIYPRSFKDSNHDGIGDLNGVREKLPYLKQLGIGFIWLNPINASPNVDNGYDISDYRKILSEFGTMADFEALLAEAHAQNIKVIMDLVINHSSDQHEWFKQALSAPDNPYREYFIFEDAVDGHAPNDWPSIFGGSAWELDEKSGQYYFHTFAKEQPDLNWESEKLRRDILAMVAWWLEKGVDGFRIDAISHIKKAPFTLMWDAADHKRPYKNFQNVPGIEEHLQELQAVFQKHDALSVGEASGVSAQQAPAWVGPSGYFNMIFSFDHIHLWKRELGEKFNIPAFKHALATWQEALDEGRGWNALYLENHDVLRSISAFGDTRTEEARVISGKALALMYFLLQGTPFIYQGQEIGMTNFPFTAIDQIDAVDSRAHYFALLAEGKTEAEAIRQVGSTTRDNARTPMQWDDTTYAGFSTHKPWLAVNPNYPTVNVQRAMRESNSLFHFFQQLIVLRKNNEALLTGRFTELLKADPQVFAYTRTNAAQHFLIVVNLDRTPTTLALELASDAQLILSNYSTYETATLQAYEARLYQIN